MASIYFCFIGWIMLFSANEECETCLRQDELLCAPNTISLNSKICIDLAEVPAYMYKDFLQSIAESEGITSPMFLDMQPDFESWTVLFEGQSAEELKQTFFESDDLALMPIVGITYEQAQAFMAWRTEQFKRELAAMEPEERSDYPANFEFRLPTKKEWGLMRFRGLDKSMKKRLRKMGDKNQKAFKLSKSKPMKDNPYIRDTYYESDATVGFFNLYDNVSEMTATKGLAVGGSWKEPNPSRQYAKEFSYDKPNAWTGFRCVMEILD